MTRIVSMPSDHGPILIEVELSDNIGAGVAMAENGLVPKGPEAAEEAVVELDTRFDKAMASLKAYVGSLQDVLGGLDVTPKEVTVEVGLTLKGEAGFFAIAKAGTEAAMKVTLTWEPGKSRAPGV